MIDKLKQLTKDTAVYGISTILGRFLNFILTPIYTHVFAPSDFGVFSNVYAYIALLNIFFIYGMDSAYLKFAANEDEKNSKDNFSTPVIAVLISSVVLSLLMILFKPAVNGVFRLPAKYDYIIYYVVSIISIDAICSLPFITLRLERKAKLFALLKITNIVINVACNLALIFFLKFGIEAVFISNLIASVSSLLLLIPTIYRHLVLRIDFPVLKRFFVFGIPYLPAGIASQIVQVIDRPIMEFLTDMKMVGIYQANYKLGIFMMLFVSMFQYAWQPFFLTNSKEENAKELFAKVLTYFTLTGSIILIFLSLYIDDLVKISFFGKTLIQQAYWGGLSIVPIVLFGYLFNGMYVNLSAGLYIEEKSIYAPITVGIGAAVNVAVNFLLIPVMGMTGAAIATLASYLIMTVSIYFITQRFYRIEYELAKLAKILAAILIIGAAFYYLSGNHLLNFFIKGGLFAAFFALLYIFGAINKKEIAAVRKLLRI
jgi:O-antigen/teichoic acid export membrane protein